MAKQPQPDTITPSSDGTEEGPQVPDFDFIDMLFGFPLAVSIAHAVFGTAGLVAGLSPVGLPVVIGALVVFVGQKALRRDPGIAWRALDFGLACLPDTVYKVLPAPVAGILDSINQAAIGHVSQADSTTDEATTSVLPGGSDQRGGTPATPAPAVATATLPMIDLATIASCSTILLVGSRGSGKSTLLRAILAARRDAVMVYDPHASPYDWPMAKLVHNSEASISKGLASAYIRLQARKDERRRGIRLSGWAGLALAADEWGSIVANVTLPPGIDKTPGEVSTELMKEGRKFNIGFVAGAHGKTNKSLGCVGDNEAFLQSFDWIINLGGFTRKMLGRDYAELFAQIPMGTNEQGGTFPLIVVCESPTTGELRLLDMRGLDKTVKPLTTVRPPWQGPAPRDDGLLTSLFTDPQDGNNPGNSLPSTGNELPPVTTGVTACSSGVTELPVGELPPLTPPEIARIARLLVTGNTASQAAKKLPGYSPRNYQAMKAKVEAVQKMLDSETPKDISATESDDSDPDIGPFGSMLGKE